MSERYIILTRVEVNRLVLSGVTDRYTANDDRIPNRYYQPVGRKFALYQIREAYDFATRIKYEMVAKTRRQEIAEKWVNGQRVDVDWIDYSAEMNEPEQ